MLLFGTTVIVAIGLFGALFPIAAVIPLMVDGDEVCAANLAIEVDTGLAFESTDCNIAVSPAIPP